MSKWELRLGTVRGIHHHNSARFFVMHMILSEFQANGKYSGEGLT
jgi:hypothetical protein